VLSASPVLADKCTLKDIKGVNVGTFTGFITGPPGNPFIGPFGGIARIVCDGKGTCSGTGTQSLNGVILPFDAANSPVTVNPDCTGTITVNPPGFPPLHFNVIQTENGKEAWSIETDPGMVISGHIPAPHPRNRLTSAVHESTSFLRCGSEEDFATTSPILVMRASDR
jgi:hypothetical protein